MAIANRVFLWYKRKDIIKEEDEQYIEAWSKLGYIQLESQDEIKEDIIEIEKPNDPNLVEKIKDFAEDILDDGKRNYSNRKKKSSKNKK